MVSSGLTPYKLPRALDSLLLYQQPSSTTLYYSYLGMPALIEIRLRNEAGKLHVYQRSSQSSSPKLPMAVDIAVGWQLPVVLATSPGLRKLGELL